MKTAKQIIREQQEHYAKVANIPLMDEEDWNNAFKDEAFKCLLRAMKEYAIQAIDRASQLVEAEIKDNEVVLLQAGFEAVKEELK